MINGVFNKPKIKRAIEQLSKVLALAPDDIGYASGSLFDGLGDEDSDFDIYVLTTADSLQRRAADFDSERKNDQHNYKFGIQYIEVEGVSFDVEFHAKENLLKLFDSLDRLKPISRQSLHENYRSLGDVPRDKAVEILHRFRIGKPFFNESGFASVKARFDEDAFFSWNALFHLMESEDFVKGTKRSLKAEDPESAYLKLCYFLNSLADAQIFLGRASCDRWKWRLPKLRTMNVPQFLAFYLSVQIPQDVSAENLKVFVEKKLLQGVSVAKDMNGEFNG
ncbi:MULTISPECIES: hypothetical protein [Pseudomonas]|uniref:Polymerase nucleotidyl transferase domain-containing protein n=1 Tax=Pseudomonas aphyarum TaxID=2942629 RepID=A0ABT5PSF1_9PSED|nr:hypothetical protein [Pseudomonas aphyarum]MDD0969010.1 hypothetical protein [Pseudomonas aphyarum]MDD1126839.1 hypothetical protein [Pseudomonas aphyarum]